jgi:hypothetical protein
LPIKYVSAGLAVTFRLHPATALMFGILAILPILVWLLGSVYDCAAPSTANALIASSAMHRTEIVVFFILSPHLFCSEKPGNYCCTAVLSFVA